MYAGVPQHPTRVGGEDPQPRGVGGWRPAARGAEVQRFRDHRVGPVLVEGPSTLTGGIVQQSMKTLALGMSLVTMTGGVGCGGDDNSGPLGTVDSLIILQRPKRNDMGDIFQYTSYLP